MKTLGRWDGGTALAVKRAGWRRLAPLRVGAKSFKVRGQIGGLTIAIPLWYNTSNNSDNATNKE
ncbi:hypothetical protein RZS08_48900, partial [Arthrospira platensis SPKY1]|nr:hypothetical protein [Arthrospira platensis SPKY1]